MKKFSLIISMIVILIISNAALAQEEDATEAIINLTIDQEGRYIGDDGYEYILVGAGFVDESDFIDAADFEMQASECSHVGYQSCAMKNAYQHGDPGSACVCRNWYGTTLEAKIKLTSPENQFAQACHLVNGDQNTNNYVCTSSIAPAKRWTTTPHFGYNLTPGYHVAGFKFFVRGNRIN